MFNGLNSEDYALTILHLITLLHFCTWKLPVSWHVKNIYGW